MFIVTLLFIIVLVAALMLNIFSMPGNWVVVALLALWKWIFPEIELTWSYWALLLGMVALAETLEFGIQMVGAKKFGSSGRGNFGGIIGAIVGAIMGAPFFFGIGAIFGALIGAFGGCLILELGQGRTFGESAKAGFGAFLGKFFGLWIKFILGTAVVVMAAYRIWV
ncbi:MAG: DUF456 domain-containing protein [Desulfovibrio sp.]|nr:MAG: DUF456 domain-containing protein [Desulfovibrio sp.]